MRPLFSVRHSPRLTNRNGVLDADRAAEHRQRHAPPAERRSSRQAARRPEAAVSAAVAASRSARMTHEDDALQHQHRRVGQVEPALQQAAARARCRRPAPPPARSPSGLLARDERDQDAGVAVAGDQRRVGGAVHRRHLDRAGQPGAAPPRRRRERSAGRPAGRPAAPRARCRRPCAARSRSVVRCTSTYSDDADDDAEAEAPVHVEPGQVPEHVRLADRRGRRLVQAGRIAQRALDEVVEQRDGDVGRAAGCGSSR